MLSLLALLFYRIREPIGEVFYIDKIKGDEINEFTKKNEISVIAFADDAKDCTFMNFAINKFGKFNWAMAPASAGEKYKCESYPCVVGFRNGKVIDVGMPAPTTPTGFTFWCDKLVDPSIINVKHAEHLRVILETGGSAVIGVDVVKRPSKLNKDRVFYSVPSQLFTDLKLTVGKGLYVYRSADRQLLPVEKDNFEVLSHTNVSIIGKEIIQGKSFIGGFILGSDNAQNEVYINMLQTLSSEFADDFALGIVPESFIEEARLGYIPKPMFAIWLNIEKRNHRFVMNGDINNIDEVRAFIQSIKTGDASSDVISEQNPAEGYLSADLLAKLDLSNDNLVIFLDNIADSLKTVLLCKKIKSFLGADNLNVYMYNVTTNDLPEKVSLASLPGLYMINENGFVAFGRPDCAFRDVFDFFMETSMGKYNIPSEIDYAKMEKEVNKEYSNELKANKLEPTIKKKKTVLK